MTDSEMLMSGIWPPVDHLVPAAALQEIAERAHDADRSGKPPAENLALLKRLRWPGLAVPAKFHGYGAGLMVSCATQREIARADPALAIAINMHLFSVGLMAEHWRRRPDTSWLLMEAIATQDRLLASAFAEPGLAGSATRSTIQATPHDGGWLVSGVKRPCSLIGEADLVCLQVQSALEADGTSEVLVALLPTTAPGLRVVQEWDALGMRASASNTLVLEEAFLPKELVFYRSVAGSGNDDIFAAGIVWFALTSTACYLGLVEAALAVARQSLDRSRIAHLVSVRADLPSYQGAVGDVVAELTTLELGCARAAEAMDADGADPMTVMNQALAVKQQAVRAVPDMVGALAEAVGGSAYSRALTLERLWRDAQAIRFHPPTSPATRQHLGRSALGRPSEVELDESTKAGGSSR